MPLEQESQRKEEKKDTMDYYLSRAIPKVMRVNPQKKIKEKRNKKVKEVKKGRQLLLSFSIILFLEAEN